MIHAEPTSSADQPEPLDVSRLLLPPSATPAEEEIVERATVLEVDGAKILLDKLGPVVVNVDGVSISVP